MQRILHINDYPANAGGGAEVVMGHTIDLLRRRGFTVESFSSAEVADSRLTPLSYVHNAAACAALSAKLDAFDPDVVHLHNYYHVLSPAILGVIDQRKRRRPMRVVMTTHDYHLACPNSGGSWFRREQTMNIDGRPMALADLLVRRWDHRGVAFSTLKLVQHWWNYRWQRRHRAIDLLICPSRFVQGMMQFVGVATCVLPHPAPPLPRRTSQRGSALSFVYAGRIEPEKGLDRFLRMMPSGYPATLTIIGDGSAKAACEHLCKQNGLADRVSFLGRLPRDETVARIAASHVLVQPSPLLETYGLTLIEALSVGTTVLAADRGASRELVEDSGAGFLFEIDNPASLVQALDAIRVRHAAGTLNDLSVGDFLAQRSEAAYVDRLLDLYRSHPSHNAPHGVHSPSFSRANSLR